MLDISCGLNLIRVTRSKIGSHVALNNDMFVTPTSFVFAQSMLERSWELKYRNLDIDSRAIVEQCMPPLDIGNAFYKAICIN
jgi:hypothetical protein